MADWQVSIEEIEVFPHPDADRLEVARVGMFPLVVAKDNGYKTGQLACLAPKRTIIPEDLRDNFRNIDTNQSYLRGGTTVKSARLRGVLSEGVVIPLDYVNKKLQENNITGEFPEFQHKGIKDLVGVDISPLLKMTEHQPDIKVVFGGDLNPVRAAVYSRHDVEGVHIFANEFEEGEEVVVTEKLHGSQVNVMIHPDGFVELSSKGMIGKGATLVETDSNVYWKAVRNSGIIDTVLRLFHGKFAQIMGEVLPLQKGFTYGFTTPTLKIFRLEVDGVRVSTGTVMTDDEYSGFRKFWVPVLYRGKYDLESIKKVCKGLETVSGKGLHIKEGGVIEPLLARNARRGWPLFLKVINPKYKGEDDDDAMS